MSHCRPQLSIRAHSAKELPAEWNQNKRDFHEVSPFAIEESPEVQEFRLERLHGECRLSDESGEELYRFGCVTPPKSVWQGKDSFWIQKDDEIFLEVRRYQPTSFSVFQTFQKAVDVEEHPADRENAIEVLIRGHEYSLALCGIQTFLEDENVESDYVGNTRFLLHWADRLFELGDPSSAIAMQSRITSDPDFRPDYRLDALKLLLEKAPQTGVALTLKQEEEILENDRLNPDEKFWRINELVELLQEQGFFSMAEEMIQSLLDSHEVALRFRAFEKWEKVATSRLNAEELRYLFREVASNRNDQKTDWSRRLKAAHRLSQLTPNAEEHAIIDKALEDAFQNEGYRFSEKIYWAKTFTLSGWSNVSASSVLSQALDPTQPMISTEERERLAVALLAAGKEIPSVVAFIRKEIQPHERKGWFSAASALYLADQLRERKYRTEARDIYQWVAMQPSKQTFSNLRFQAAEALEAQGEKTLALQAFESIGLDPNSSDWDQEECLKILQKRGPKKVEVFRAIEFNIVRAQHGSLTRRLASAQELLQEGYQTERVLDNLYYIVLNREIDFDARLNAAQLYLQYSPQENKAGAFSPASTVADFLKEAEEEKKKTEIEMASLRMKLQSQSGSVEERFNAAKNLWDLGDQKDQRFAADAIRSLLQEKSPSKLALDMVEWGVQKNFHWKEMDSTLRAVFDGEQNEGKYLLDAAELLKRMGKKSEAQEKLSAIALDQSQEPWHRVDAADEIEERPLKIKAYLDIATTTDHDNSVADRLLKIGERTLAASVLSKTSGEDGLRAAETLLRLGEIQLAVKKAQAVAEDPSLQKWKRKWAIDLLVEVGATEEVIGAYKKLIIDFPDDDSQEEWTKALAELNRDAAIQFYEGLLKESDPQSPQYARSSRALSDLYHLSHNSF